MVFDINKIPIKYIIGSFVDDPLYPSPDDILYLMTRRCHDKGKSLEPVIFTDTILFKKIDEKYHDNTIKSLETLMNNDSIKVTRVSKTGKSYSIIKNPFL